MHYFLDAWTAEYVEVSVGQNPVVATARCSTERGDVSGTFTPDNSDMISLECQRIRLR